METIRDLFNSQISGNGFSLHTVFAPNPTTEEKKSANIIGVVEFARIIGQLSRIGKIQIDEGAFYEQREFVEKSVSSDLFGTDDIIATDLGEENPGLYALFFQMSNTGNSAKEMIVDWGFKNTK